MEEEEEVEIANPDEIRLEDDEEPVEKAVNPDEIVMDDEEDGEADAGVQSEEKGGSCACEGTNEKNDVEMEVDTTVVSSAPIVPEVEVGAVEAKAGESNERTTKFLALSKPGGNRDFLQVSVLSHCSLSHATSLSAEADSRFIPDYRYSGACWLRTINSTASSIGVRSYTSHCR